MGHFDILASGKTDCRGKLKETLFIQELQMHWMPMSAVKSFYFIIKAFSLFTLETVSVWNVF